MEDMDTAIAAPVLPKPSTEEEVEAGVSMLQCGPTVLS